MKKLILIFVLSIFMISNVKAQVLGLTQSGDSLQGKVKIGYNYVGQGFYEFSSGTTDSSDLDMDIGIDFQSGYPTITGTKEHFFYVDYCTNGSLPTLSLRSKYSNFIDYTYSLGTYIYVTSGDWARTNCYRSYIRLNLNYNVSIGTQGNDYITLTDNSNWFDITADYGYNILLRYQDLVYFNADDYNTSLSNAKLVNQNSEIINSQTTINNNISNIDNTITNDNVDSPNNSLSGLNSYLATNSTISNLITLPITLFQKVLSSLNGTCSSYDLGEYKGTHIILPCINISNYIGSTLFNVIDILLSGLLIYKMSRKFIAVFHNLSSMKEGDVISD